MVFPVPDDMSDEVAVLADPFSVSLHAIARTPPRPAAAWSCTAPAPWARPPRPSCGPCTPTSRSPPSPASPPRWRWPSDSGPRCSPPSREQLLEELAAWSGATLRRPWEGLPVAYPGKVDVVYDTVGYPQTVEVGLRLLAHGGALVQLGVASPARFEWTPWYFKELRLIGSNAFGVETVEGVRRHAIEHYLDLAGSGRIDLTGMLTHTFRLDDWRDAFRTIVRQGDTGAVKVAFDFR